MGISAIQSFSWISGSFASTESGFLSPSFCWFLWTAFYKKVSWAFITVKATKCKLIYDLHLQGILLLATSFVPGTGNTRSGVLWTILRAQKERSMMNKLRIFFTDFNKLKLINLSAHTNEKVQFGWLWLTLNMTSPIFLILQKCLQTLFWERKLREKSRTKGNLFHLQPERQKICFSLISWVLFSLWILK